MSHHHPCISKTRSSIFFSNLIHEPFVSLYALLPFILVNNFKVAAFQIVLLTMLQPIASIFSFYWSDLLSQRKHTLKMNLLGAGLLARIPFIIAIFFNNAWLLIFASTLYMLFLRASIPAWVEMLKINLPSKLREKYFAIGSAIGYGEGVFIAIGVGMLLDANIATWRILYLIALLLGLIGVLIQVSLPIREGSHHEKTRVKKKQGIKKSFVNPWLDCIHLMKTRPDFRRFQWAFMIGGFGLMLAKPVIPFYFAQTLHLSYCDLMIAYSICKGLGFVLTSPVWSRSMSILSVGQFTALVLTGFGAFSLLIVLGVYGSFWIYLAFFVYGIAQAGSHLIWHLSGPLFSQEEKSARFSSVNIVMCGVRGMLAPPLGGVLGVFLGPIIVLYLSAILCLSAVSTMFVRVPKRLTQVAS